MNNKIDVSVVLGSYNRKLFLKGTIKSIRKELDKFNGTSEILVVDGGSTDGSVKWLAKQKDIITIVQHNRGVWRGKRIPRRSWGFFMNLVFKSAHGKYVCMVSDDCLIVPGAVQKGYDLFEDRLNAGDKIGAAAFYWRDWPGEARYWIGTTFGKIFLNHGLYLKEALEDIGYIDEDTYSFYYGDTDLCLRMYQNGWEIIEAPDSFIEHYQEANLSVRSTNDEKDKVDFDTFSKKWKKVYNREHEGPPLEKYYTDEAKTGRAFILPKLLDFQTYFYRIRFLFVKVLRKIK